MIHSFSPVLMLGIALTAGAAITEEPSRQGLEFSGYMYADIGAFSYLPGGLKDSSVFSGTTVLDTRFMNVNRSHAKVEGDFEVILPYGVAAELYTAGLRSNTIDSVTQNADRANTRYFDLSGMGKSPILLDMRKLYLEAYLPFADIAVGRQIINFGKGLIFSPIDAFSTVQIMDLNFRRNGSDVANARIPLGDLSGIDCIVEAPFGNNEHSSAAKFFTTIAGWDVSMVGLYRHLSGESLAGAAFKGDAVVGLYGELVEHIVKGIDDQYFEGMTGVDYSIHNTWFFNAEYYYNDRPATKPSLWGHNNTYTSIQFAPNELMRLSVIGLYQFEEHRAIGMLAWDYSVLQNADLTAYIRGYDHMHGIGVPDLQYAIRAEVTF